VGYATLILQLTLLLGCSNDQLSQPTTGACSQIEGVEVPAISRGGLEDGPHTVIWQGIRFWYCVSGNAQSDLPPVVFLHGGPGEGSQHFAALVGSEMESDLQIVYFDQRGSGRSERPWTREYGIDVLVDDVEDLRKALGVEQIVVLGHSFGGLLALEYAASFPERVSHLILVSSLADIPGSQRSVCDRLERLDSAAYARAMQQPLPGGLCNSFAAYSGTEAEQYARNSMYPNPRTGELVDSADSAGGLRNTGELSRALFSIPDLMTYRFDGHDRLTIPSLVVAGRHDHQVGLAPQERLAAELPNARLVILENGGHFPHVDDPQAFIAALRSFFGLGF
jgi:proline iminopeptidase